MDRQESALIDKNGNQIDVARELNEESRTCREVERQRSHSEGEEDDVEHQGADAAVRHPGDFILNAVKLKEIFH